MTATITWFGHSTIRLTLPDERVVFIDPWLAQNPSCPDSLKKPPRCDFLLLTHGHADHVGDVESLVKAFNPLVVGNFELCGVLEKRIGCGRYSGMNTGGTQTIDGLRVTLTQAFHSSSLDSEDGPIYTGMPNGIIVSVDGLATLYHAGDTDVFSDMKLLARMFAPSVCFLPIGDHFTMGAAGAAMAAAWLQPRTIVPIHYMTFPMLAQSADAFREALAPELRDRLVVPSVGRALIWSRDGLESA